MQEASVEDDESRREGEREVSPALIAVHPLEKSVVVAVGSELRVFDLIGGHAIALSDDSEGPPHSDSIRAICFDAKGELFASAGDDKLVKVWNVDSWQCICTVCSEKRVSAVAISHDGLFVCFADKFGVVWIVAIDGEAEHQVPVGKKALPLLGHYCSIITSLEFSPDGKFIASADRDFKIRITMFPRTPLKGAHEIQSFCLGHTEFVSCLAFAHLPDHPHGFLLSGGGDSTVRLWDFMSGSLLDTCEVGAKVDLVDDNVKDGLESPVVTSLCICHDGSVIAVAVQSLNGVVLLSCNFSAKTLSFARVLSTGKGFVPTSLGMSTSVDCLWMVMGASGLSPSGMGRSLARVKVVRGFHELSSDTNAQDLAVLEDNEVPGGSKLLEKLQGGLDVDKDAESLAEAAQALKTAMRNLLIKRQYSVEKRELRKKSRNDRKFKR